MINMIPVEVKDDLQVVDRVAGALVAASGQSSPIGYAVVVHAKISHVVMSATSAQCRKTISA